MNLIELSDQAQQAIDKFVQVSSQQIQQYLTGDQTQHWINLDNVQTNCRQPIIDQLVAKFAQFNFETIGNRVLVTPRR